MPHCDDCISFGDFARLRDLIYSESGIALGAGKKVMLEGRIRRRLKALAIDSFRRYCGYLFSDRGRRDELVHLIEVVTTNKTDFFREPRHFEFLSSTVLPKLAEMGACPRPVLAWSAGCSTGEEPYTLAIVLSEFAEAHPGFRFRILATDISAAVLGKAEMAIYTAESAAPISPALRKKYLLRSRDRSSDRLRVVPELRRLVEFRQLNFMSTDYGLTAPADAIFCRNVLIYFDRPTQQEILRRLSACLAPQGYLFIGHSETVREMDLPLEPVAPAVYRRSDARD
jgi:chemotaxis protein methyltransferase CheR